MNRNSLDLVCVTACALAAALVSLLGLNIPLAQPVLAALLVLVLPGYALTAALFPGRTPGAAERTAFALGTSLCLAVFAGLLLHWTPWGLQGGSWAVVLSGLTVCAAAVALQRRTAQLRTVTSGPSARTAPRRAALPRFSALGVRYMIVFVLAGGILLGTLQSARTAVLDQPNPEVTQLWLLPAETGNTVQLGIGSLEAIDMNYKLQLKAKDQILKEWSSVTLKPGERWETSLELPAGALESQAIEAVLYRLNAPQDVYRRVTLQPNSQAGGGR